MSNSWWPFIQLFPSYSSSLPFSDSLWSRHPQVLMLPHGLMDCHVTTSQSALFDSSRLTPQLSLSQFLLYPPCSPQSCHPQVSYDTPRTATSPSRGPIIWLFSSHPRLSLSWSLSDPPHPRSPWSLHPQALIIPHGLPCHHVTVGATHWPQAFCADDTPMADGSTTYVSW